jgi:uncharacterized membrane protein
LIAGFFVSMGVLHFVAPDRFVRIVPPYLPAPLALVYASGVFEMLGGTGLLLAATRRAAGCGLIVLLVAIYPANIHMALHPADFPEISPTALYARLPLQLVIVALVWWAAGVSERRLRPGRADRAELVRSGLRVTPR